MNQKNLPAALTAPTPAPTPQHAKSLSPQQLSEHRQKIAFDVKTVLSAYFQPHEADEIKAAQLAWWCDELQDWTQEQVVWALRKWNRDNPRIRPTPGDIVAICKDARGRRITSKASEARPMTREEREAMEAQRAKAREINPERKAQADAILNEFGLKKIGEVK